MVLWGFRWFKLFLNPYANDEFEHISESDRRIYILGRLEDAEFSEWSWVVIVAGVGFFTDAYSIFAINMVLPMLGILYYGGTIPHTYETALSVVTLGGSIIGQVAFGLCADIWGRRKMYGLELIITIGATLGVVMSSNGINGSMSIIAWLLVWRFVLGIGIGADYPLSAVICSEFAPTRLRGRMLTAVFMCQPLGQLAATLVTWIAAARQRNGIIGIMPENCHGECIKTLDSVWRWIIGVGVIPAVIALWFRLTIIESPRYTADVGRDSRKAASELNQYLLLQAQAQTAAASTTSLQINSGGVNNATTQRTRNGSFGAASGAASIAQSGAASDDGASQRDISPVPHSNFVPKPQENGFNTSTRPLRPASGAFSDDGNLEHAMTHPGVVASNDAEQNEIPPIPTWKEFKQFFWHDGNLRTLIATSLCWFCLDLPFYGLGMNSPRIINTIWNGKNPQILPIYDLIEHDIWQSLVVVSLGAIVGSLITLTTIDWLGRRNIQINGFFWLFILFIVIGGSFNHLYEIGGSPAIIVLYILCQIFFNFGPNTTTYILPAELFPTRYRGLCHGISAAFGKLGSVVAQLFLAYINYGHNVDYQIIQKWLPYSLLVFSIFMLLGLWMTWKWIPGQERGPDGEIKTLEEWAGGRETPNKFAQTRLAKVVEVTWKFIAHIAEESYLGLDKLVGGDERERREQAKRDEEEMQAVGGGILGNEIVGEPAPFVNERTSHT
ncbi:major facilitator superfamily domain-containing protein [Tricladium varicosporioides]|nr:major facilitator superfamily domain-containing protein [Hymenoscyphus varicosporioides]